MKTRFVALGRCALAFLLATSTLAIPSPAQEQERLRYDPSAVFKTHVRHLKSVISPGAKGPEGAQLAVTNTVFSGSKYTVGPTVTPTTTLPEAEEEIAVDPNRSSNLVAAISDFALNFGFNTTKFAFSYDNGATWTESYIPLDPFFGLPATGDGFFWFANSDPVVAIDKMGNVYLSDLYLDAIDNGNGLYVSVGTVSGGVGSFSVANTFPVVTNPDPNTPFLEDKPWITVDNSSNPATTGSVYVAWSHFSSSTSDFIALSRSLNHGQTWTAPIRISPPAQDGAVQGAQVAVGPTGEVYVAYEVFYTGNNRQQFLTKSIDGGQTFRTPVAITPFFSDLTFKSSYRKNSLPAMAVDPTTGDVAVLYAAQVATQGAEVEFILSTNGGASFSSPATINDVSTGQHFMPAVVVDASGVIHASWFDTRNSPTTTSKYDIYATFSKDHGGSFAPNARVTSALVNAGNTSFIGDYSGNAASGGFAHPVWTSGGGNNGRLETAKLTTP
jgi:hypothetical protein